VTAGPLARLACTDCHGTVPALTPTRQQWSPLWSALATSGGVLATPVTGTVTPGTTPTCTNYCHGGKWAAPGAANDAYRGFNTSPDWTSGAPEVTCGSCHAVPPTSPAHAAVGATKSCGDCHTGYACTTGNLAACTVNKTTHVNGASDAAGQTCASCHGTAGRSIAAGTLGPAESANNLLAVPPLDHLGSATSTRVGPHQAHATRPPRGPSSSSRSPAGSATARRSTPTR
jgi:predicted CxxxxCH...CXXCH cytochrome family protein